MSKNNADKAALRTAFLEQAVFEGWSEKTLEKAASGLGIEPLVWFPQGIESFTDDFAGFVNLQMEQQLTEKQIKNLRIRERIAAAVTTRLELLKPHKLAIRRLLAYYALPQHAAQAARHLFEASSAMWYAAGDTSTDYNYYTKRLLLSGVYSSTLLYWMQDNSPDFADTREFLNRRIENVMQIEKAKAKAKDFFGKFGLVG